MTHDRSPDRSTAGLAGGDDGDLQRGIAGADHPESAGGGGDTRTLSGGPVCTCHAGTDAFSHAIAYAQPFTVAISLAQSRYADPHRGHTRTAADSRTAHLRVVAGTDAGSHSESDAFPEPESHAEPEPAA